MAGFEQPKTDIQKLETRETARLQEARGDALGIPSLEANIRKFREMTENIQRIENALAAVKEKFEDSKDYEKIRAEITDKLRAITEKLMREVETLTLSQRTMPREQLGEFANPAVAETARQEIERITNITIQGREAYQFVPDSIFGRLFQSEEIESGEVKEWGKALSGNPNALKKRFAKVSAALQQKADEARAEAQEQKTKEAAVAALRRNLGKEPPPLHPELDDNPNL